MRRPILLVLAATALPVHASSLDALFALQRNGLWEAYSAGNPAPTRRYCITDAVRLNGVQATADAFAQMGCKPDSETITGAAFEVVYACTNADPNLGNFRLAMSGSAGADHMTIKTTISGGGRMIQQMAPAMNTTEEWRRARDCAPGEKPGLQPP